MSFEDIPEELFEYILTHLSPYGELQSCRLVSKFWNRLSCGALLRLKKVCDRCDAFEWLYLQQLQVSKYTSNVAAERCSHAACFHSGTSSVYVFGGCTAAYTTFNDLWRFDLPTRVWRRPIPTGNSPTPKACATMVEYKNRLVIFGGWSKSSPNPIHQTAMFFNELHMYDPVGNDWRTVNNDGSAPHLAGHSASVIDDEMIVFGGSHGRGSSNNVWVFNFIREEWSTPSTSTPKPIPRYGQSQIFIDDTHLLIVGGCGGPNLIFHDVWLLSINRGGVWEWHEITVTNPQMSAPVLWSHPACKVSKDKAVVLSKPLRCQVGSPSFHRAMSSTNRTGEVPPRAWVPPQGNLIPPRRKLISSRSLDEQNSPPSPKAEERKLAELQRARSIPTIIVGEIPKLVVTAEDNSGDSSGSETGVSGVPGPGTGQNIDPETASTSRNPQYIAMVASSLLPNQATQVNPAEALPPQPQGAQGATGGGPQRPAAPTGPASGRAHPSIKPNATKNREKQLEMLRRMEEYIRSRSEAQGGSSNENPSGDGSGSPSTSGKMQFRPSSPPPKSKHRRPDSFLLAKKPMNIYVLNMGRLLEERVVSWNVLEGSNEGPEDTILYSLVKGRGELIMFGGMRTCSQSEQQLDVTPFTHTITNETLILRPPINR